MKALVVIFLLASSAFAADNPQLANATAACGPKDAKFSVSKAPGQPTMPQAEPGKAIVYVIEDPKWNGFVPPTTRVGLDGAWVGANRGKTYIVFSVSAGEHHLCTDWPRVLGKRSVAVAKLDAEQGKIYYFRARVASYRGSHDILDLDSIDVDQAQLLMASAGRSKSQLKK